MGDLNVIAETTSGQPCPEYKSLLAYFHSFSVTDVYRTLHPDASEDPGYSYDAVANRLIAIFAPPDTGQGLRQRLDYMFAAGLTTVRSEPLNTTYQYQDPQTGEAMDLSDHYPLLSSFTVPSPVRDDARAR